LKVKFLQKAAIAVEHALDPNRNGFFQINVKARDVMDLPDEHADSLIISRVAVAADPQDVVTVMPEETRATAPALDPDLAPGAWKRPGNPVNRVLRGRE
jgi:hypothetical protein